MAKLIIHFVFALIVLSYFSSESEALGRIQPEPTLCHCPGDKAPECDCLPPINHQVHTTSTIGPNAGNKQLTGCAANNECL
ncbi:hypothetical protein ISN44_As11g028240 [Arabidopsis suecica]|uniref:Uncharacterized protein n=1 Tax=Arabidopsis suecica TaxID=45249 RepID=A0A8T1ZDE9_ARASU|nr:hypothetical protein ISN44_As11g028240 [Arabidopsis suecica]